MKKVTKQNKKENLAELNKKIAKQPIEKEATSAKCTQINVNINKNDELDVEIIDYGADGEGIAKINGYTIFVKGALKGELCKIHIVKALKTHAFANVVKIIKESPYRQESDCLTFPRCGGCTLRHIKYDETLRIKQEKVQNLFNKTLANAQIETNLTQKFDNTKDINMFFDDTDDNEKGNKLILKDIEDKLSEENKNANSYIKVENTIGMKTPFYYRNKAIYPISQDKKVGIYASRSHNIIPIEECKIQTIQSQEIAKYIAQNWNDTIYDEKSKKGLLRNVMIRESFTTGEVMCVLVQNGTENLKTLNNPIINETNVSEPYSDALHLKGYKISQKENNKIQEKNKEEEINSKNVNKSYTELKSISIENLIKKFPKIKTVVVNVNKENTNVVLSRENILIYGSGYITDILGGYKFRISPNSFYQVNSEQTEKIYKTAIEKANLNKNDILCDLYCGIGTIGIFASKYVKKVYGIEVVPEAIKDARENAKINKIENIEFIEGNVEIAFEKLLQQIENTKENENINLKRVNNNNKRDTQKCKDFGADMSNKDFRVDMPNVVIVDPPRKGLDNTTIQNLKKLKLQKIIYVSCNPATLVRDLKNLSDIYIINEVIPIDNFCFSSHVETVVALSLK